MEFKVWDYLYILGINKYYPDSLHHRRCEIIAVKEISNIEYELVCNVLGEDDERFKVKYDSFGFTHPKTRTIGTDEEVNYLIHPSDQCTLVFLTAQELYKIIRKKWCDYQETNVVMKKWLLNKSIEKLQLYDDPKNIDSDIAKRLEEETLSTKK